MKRKTVLKICAALTGAVLAISCSGCDLSLLTGTDTVSITSVRKTATNGLVDTYTIYFSDGSKSTFEITNGKNGKNGENAADISAADLYETYKSIYGDDLTYEDFLEKYLTIFEKESGYTAINESLRSMGKVYCEFQEKSSSIPSDGTESKLYTGACVIYQMNEEYTYFLTNYHVVYDTYAVTTSKISETIHCYLYGSEDTPTKTTTSSGTGYTYGDYAISCEYVGGSATYDLAIVKAKTTEVERINDDVCPVTFAKDYYVGETAIAIGHPNGEGISVTQGIVSVDNEFISLSVDGTTRFYRSIRIDAPLYKGNSGGGLFNENGELIGIANAGDIDAQNINYAVPLQIVKAVASNIMINGSGVYKPTIGVTCDLANSRYVYDEKVGYGKIKEDVIVESVESASIAETIGLAAGDKITAVVVGNTRYEVNRYFDIGDALLYLTEGVTFCFEVTRGTAVTTTATYTVAAADLKNIA